MSALVTALTLAQEPPAKETLAPINYPAVLPVLIILGAACVGVLFEAFLPKHQRWSAQVFLTLLALVGSGVALAFYLSDAPAGGELTLSSTISVDRPALVLWGTLLALSLGAVLMIADRSVEPGGAFVATAAIRPGTVQDREQRLGAHPSRRDAARYGMQTEVFPLTLFALGGMALLIVGLLFKGSVGPFHAWTPDVYQGAPTPITAFMAACTKVAAFGGIMRVLSVGLESTQWEWRGILWGVAIVSMIIGAVLGLTQTDIKRMIAYSSIAHAGFLLIGAIVLNPDGVSSTLFYLLAYGFTTVAAFGVISLVRDADGEATHLSQWAGLAKRSPLVAAVFTFLLLALAGIPLTSGFIGKFVVFQAALSDGMAPLVVVALVASAIAAFFYLRVIVLMYFSEPAADGPSVTVPGAFTTAAITLGVVITLLLGIVPAFALDWAAGGTFAVR